jgi:NAD(P)H dehydrogenase (quinone)
MTSLIIVAHPKKSSLSFAIAEKYKKIVEQKGYKAQILDLYTDENQQPFFTYENDPYDQKRTKEMLYYQNMISNADELVFIFPYWWGTFPAILKNFFDWNFSMGFAAKFENGRPKGLLTNKIVKVFTTTGTPKWLYCLTGANRRLKNMFKEQIISFCGMKLEEFNIFGGIDTNSKNTKKILEKIK